MGIAIGNVLYSNAETIYESTATVRIEHKKLFTVGSPSSEELYKNFEDPPNIRHDRLINQENIILPTLQTIKTNQSSGVLRSLQDFTNAEKFEYISRNLNVEQDREEPAVYIATLRNSHDNDCQKILGGVLATYKKYLADSFEENDGHRGFRFLMLSEPSFGKVVWPILSSMLLTGGVLGMLGGFVLGFLIEAVAK